MAAPIDTLLLFALPASGKSEVRRYFSHLDPERRRRELHLGHLVQLDDFPYVHLMRRTSEVLRARGLPAVFFEQDDASMSDARDWGTLIELVNEDHAALTARRRVSPDHAGSWLLDRLEAARDRVGIRPELSRLPPSVRETLARELEADAAALVHEQNARAEAPERDRTVVIEFARGGPYGATMPLPAPFGYRHSLAKLAPAILERAAVLYVWVTPEESRRKNRERANPNDPGSILHHGVPEAVMLNDYGCDDIDSLETASGRPGAVRVDAHGRSWTLPLARFDNRRDRTSFLRAEPAQWPAAEVSGLHAMLSQALGHLAAGVAPVLVGRPADLSPALARS